MTAQFYLTRIMPIGLFMALTLYFGNIVYLYLTVSFIQMLKVRSPAVPQTLSSLQRWPCSAVRVQLLPSQQQAQVPCKCCTTWLAWRCSG